MRLITLHLPSEILPPDADAFAQPVCDRSLCSQQLLASFNGTVPSATQHSLSRCQSCSDRGAFDSFWDWAVRPGLYYVPCSPLQLWFCTPTAYLSTRRHLHVTPGWFRYDPFPFLRVGVGVGPAGRVIDRAQLWLAGGLEGTADKASPHR